MPASADTGAMSAVTVDDASNYVTVATVKPIGLPITLTFSLSSGGAIAHLILEAQVSDTSPWITIREDSDFSTAGDPVLLINGSGLPGTPIYQTAASGNFTLKLDGGFSGYRVRAKKATSNVVITPYQTTLNR